MHGVASKGTNFDGSIVGVLGEQQRAGALFLQVFVVLTDSMLYFERREDQVQDDRLIFTLQKQSCRVPPSPEAPALENGDYEIAIPDSINEVYFGYASPETLLWRRLVQ